MASDDEPDSYPYSQVQWLISDYDFRTHAFYQVAEDQQYLEALCQHTVPPEKIVRPEETVLAPPLCAKCLLKQGEDMASHIQRWTD